MPRSHSEHAYPSVYWKLIERFRISQLPIHVECASKAEAYNKRNEWNSFVRALERNSSKNPHYAELVQIARSRTCSVSRHNEKLLMWKARDLESFTASLESAIDEFDVMHKNQQSSFASPREISLAEPFDAPLRGHSGELLVMDEIPSEPVAPAMDDLLDDFLATPEEDTRADELFDHALDEAQAAIDEDQEEQGLLGLLDSKLKPINTRATFSSEEESDGTEGQIS